MKFCTKCGAQLNEGAKFCNRCGSPVTDAVAKNGRNSANEAPAQNENGIKPQGAFDRKKFGISDSGIDSEKSKLPRKKFTAIIAAGATSAFLLVLFLVILPAVNWRNADNFKRIVSDAAAVYGTKIDPNDWEMEIEEGMWDTSKYTYTYLYESKDSKDAQLLRITADENNQVIKFYAAGYGTVEDGLPGSVDIKKNLLIVGILMTNPELAQNYNYDLTDKKYKIMLMETENYGTKFFYLPEDSYNIESVFKDLYYMNREDEKAPEDEDLTLGTISIYENTDSEDYTGFVHFINRGDRAVYAININYDW